jgi:hypothetical protein
MPQIQFPAENGRMLTIFQEGRKPVSLDRAQQIFAGARPSQLVSVKISHTR